MPDDPHDPHRPLGGPEPREPGHPAHQPYAPPPGGHPPAPIPYGYGPPPPGGQHPGYGGPVSDKSKTTAGLLQLLLPFFGICGVGRLYAGHVGIGVTQLVGTIASFCAAFFLVGIPFLIGFLVWGVVDGIIMLTSDATRDGHGRLMR